MEPPSSRLSVLVLNESSARGLVAGIRRAVQTVYALHGRTEGTVSVLLCDDDRIQELNRDFRQVDETTDVLSFPAPPNPHLEHGDIAISVPYASRQGQVRGVDLKTEICYLAIHGALHLIGFDDEIEADRRIMHSEMNRAIEAIGLRPEPEWTSVLHEVTR